MLGKRMLVPVKKISLKETFQVPTEEIEALLPPQITFEVENLKERKIEKEKPEIAVKEEKVAVKEEVVEETKEEVIVGSGDYIIQFGAFRNRDNAYNLVANLKKKGFQAKVLKTGYYKVLSKESFTLSEARSKLASLKAAGFDGLIRKK